MRVGVVDVGTNSVRLLVCETTPWREIERDLVITRLGEGVDAGRVLGAEPLRRTVAAIASSVELVRAHGVDAVRIIATSAVRDASNREDFVAAVQRATGVRPDVLSGDHEARLGFSGAAHGIGSARLLVCDIGGGSTELIVGASVAERFLSLDIGSVRLTERHLASDPPTASELDALRADARAHLARAASVLGDTGGATFVGLAGTITTMAAVALGVERYDRARIHGARLTRGMVADVTARIAAMTTAERRSLPVMPRGREDVIVGGAAILEEAMDLFGAAEVTVSESDILDGAALEVARVDT